MAKEVKTEKISVTRALAEKKNLENRIDKAIRVSVFVTQTTGEKPVTGYEATKDFEKEAKSNFDSITALINRKAAIKSAIAKSNAVTKVKIGDTEMTVTEAIDYKNNVIENKESLLSALTQQLHVAERAIETQKERNKVGLENHLKTLFGENKAKANQTEIEEQTKLYEKQHGAVLVDPIKVRAKIKELEEEIENFNTNIDYALTEINTRTDIEVPA